MFTILINPHASEHLEIGRDYIVLDGAFIS